METTSGGDNAQPTYTHWTGLAYAEVFVRGEQSTSTASSTPTRETQEPPREQRVEGGASDSAPGLFISVSPSSVRVGGESVLSWFAEGIRSCSFSGNWPGSVAEGAARAGRDSSASSRIFNILETSVYRLSCVGVDGVSRAVSATVNVR